MQLPNPSLASESEVVGQTPALVFDMALAGYALLSLPRQTDRIGARLTTEFVNHSAVTKGCPPQRRIGPAVVYAAMVAAEEDRSRACGRASGGRAAGAGRPGPPTRPSDVKGEHPSESKWASLNRGK